MKIFGAFCLTILLLAVIVSAIGVVWTRHESRILFVELSRLQSQKDDLGVEYGRLELEQATYAEPSRIDAEARARLSMYTPKQQDIQLVRR
ncbi:cell division protein FtsL [Luteibacter anthropi]|uniref:Cell division protein FtsL n=1 Tax=Luteibacter anthropi TaxID=564369 RepID=A0A7X5UEM5_9GAMM|nr:cell division protein FtsL [Luteibacter anthropi]NII09012.1 cell division protein FtsL [Luteibacter anthropi]URX64438.1 cell division protein FtsL [Luteibacter anthropi]